MHYKMSNRSFERCAERGRRRGRRRRRDLNENQLACAKETQIDVTLSSGFRRNETNWKRPISWFYSYPNEEVNKPRSVNAVVCRIVYERDCLYFFSLKHCTLILLAPRAESLTAARRVHKQINEKKLLQKHIISRRFFSLWLLESTWAVPLLLDCFLIWMYYTSHTSVCMCSNAACRICR